MLDIDSSFINITKALDASSPIYDEALSNLADIKQLLNNITYKKSKYRVYTKKMQKEAISKILGFTDKTISEVHNPNLTKREIIAIADWIKENINE